MIPFSIGFFLGCIIIVFLVSITDDRRFSKKYQKRNYHDQSKNNYGGKLK